MNPLRICMITREYAQDTQLGGIGRATSMQARILAAAGAEVHVLTLAASAATHYVEHGVHVHRITDPKGYLAPDMVYAHVVRWAKAVADAYAELDARVGFDVVEAPEYWGETLHLPLRAETPLVVTLHGLTELLEAHNIDDPPTPGQRVLYALELAAIRGAQLLLAPTQLILDDTRALLHTDEPPARLLPLSFDASRFPLREPRAIAPGARRLVFTGRIERRKGVDYAVRAAAAIARRGYDTELLVVGRDWSGYRERVVEPLISELGFDGVRFVSEVGEAQVAELLRSADCALMPSRQENFHMAANEALCSGVPVITSDRNGLTCWHDRDRGLLGLPLDDPERFGELAADALEDADWLAHAGRRGAENVRALLAPERVGGELLEIFGELVERAGGRWAAGVASTPAARVALAEAPAPLPVARGRQVGIPRLIHQVWCAGGAPPQDVVSRAEAWERRHPDWRVVLWTEETLPPLHNQAIFDACEDAAQKAQIARYELLLRYGGIAVDCELECRRSLEPLLDGIDGFVVARPDRKPTATIMGAVGGHGFVEAVVAALPRGIAAAPDGPVAQQTGEDFLAAVLNECVAQRRALPTGLPAHTVFPDAPVPAEEPDPEPYVAPARDEAPRRFVVALDLRAPGTVATVVRAFCSGFGPGDPVELALCVPDEPDDAHGGAVTALLRELAPDPASVPDVVVYSFDEVLTLPYVGALTAAGDDLRAGVEAADVLAALADVRAALDARAPLPRQSAGETLAAGLRDRLVTELRRSSTPVEAS